MQDAAPQPRAHAIDRSFKTDRVDNPQQYSSWRDYAFSEEPEAESESTLRR
jgi:hypothetical protein